MGALLELHFYRRGAGSGYLLTLVEHLLSRGALLAGDIRIHRGDGFKTAPFMGRIYHRMEYMPVQDMDEIRGIEADNNIRIVEVPLVNLMTKGRGKPDLVTHAMISEYASGRDSHPVAIWTAGDNIGNGDPRSQALSRKAYKVFRDIVEGIDPDYAAITGEYDLECLTDLRADPRSMAFSSFYLAGDFLDEASTSRINAICDTAKFSKALGRGRYCCFTGLFSPNPPKSTKSVEAYRYAEIPRIIATARVNIDRLS